ncbi:MAG: winged helix-turn-helix transcriptional regulator [Peptostreptococcaceae bacterium]|nr:winged helix-turn-helix transcriptional regulator [Peptostreptococcaceae bacterium]
MLQETIKALNDPVRRKILEILKTGPKNVGEILVQLDITGATLSHHLKILRDTGLLSDTKEGNHIIYEINTSVFEDVMSWITGLINSEVK